jgi:hypothetical protein
LTEVCPKCRYPRNQSEVVPQTQCPSCGIVYATGLPPEPLAPEPERQKQEAPKRAPLKAVLAGSESARLLPVFAIIHVLLFYWAFRYTADPGYHSLIDLALVPVHELGHPLFAPLGHFMGALGGSLAQWGLPVAITLGFARRRDPYAVCIGLFLGGVSIHNSCQYMDSAFQMEKYPHRVFVSLNEGEGENDWQVIFGAMGLYKGYTMVALADRLMGLALIWGSLSRGAWLLWQTAKGTKAGE